MKSVSAIPLVFSDFIARSIVRDWFLSKGEEINKRKIDR